MSDYDSKEISTKWNQKYLSDERFQDTPVRKLVRQYASLLPAAGQALEIAGGLGGTADFLQRRGLRVVEIDIAYQALQKAAKRNESVCFAVADARYLPFRVSQFDLICNFYFLERIVFNTINALLKPGGILFFETMTLDMQSIRPEIPAAHLLQAGELRSVFAAWKIIHYFEGWTDSDHGKRKAIAQLVAQKPARSV